MGVNISARLSLLYILPAIGLIAGVVFIPLWIVVAQSFHAQDGSLSLTAYRSLAENPIIGRVLLTTLSVCVITTVIVLFSGYCVAYYLSLQSPRRRYYLTLLVLLPLWTSLLVKSFAFTVIFGGNNPVNRAIVWLMGQPEGATPFLFNRAGVIIGLVQWLIPFMVFPVLASLLSQDKNLYCAAEVMGAGKSRIFWRITVPLSLPGVAAGCFIVFILAFGSFITPALLGGRKDMMVGNLISFYIHDVLNWPLASAVAVVLLVVSVMLGIALSLLPGALATMRGTR